MKNIETKEKIFTKYYRQIITSLVLFSVLIINPSCKNDDNTAPSTPSSTTSSTTSGTTAGTTSNTTSGSTAGSTSGTTSGTTSSTTSGSTAGTTSGTTSGSTTSTPQTMNVSIGDNFFSPATMTVSAGTTVVWKNNGAVTHTVTSNSGLFDSGNLAPGSTFQFTFPSAGTFPYHCNIHSNMTGSVTVQ